MVRGRLCPRLAGRVRPADRSCWPRTRKPSQSPAGGTQLPKPDPAFKGKIGETYKDSTPDYPQPVKAPKGSPNVLLDPARRRRLRHVLDVRRAGADAAPGQARQERAEVHPVPHHRAVQPDAGRAARRPQPPQLSAPASSSRWAPATPATPASSRRSTALVSEIAPRQRLRHRHVRQVAQHARAGHQPRRAVRPLAHRPGLRLLLRLQPGRDEPVLPDALPQHRPGCRSRRRPSRATTSPPT